MEQEKLRFMRMLALVERRSFKVPRVPVRYGNHDFSGRSGTSCSGSSGFGIAGVRPYVCDQCGSTFSRQVCLNNHLPCDYDETAYSHKSTAKSHPRAPGGGPLRPCSRSGAELSHRDGSRSKQRAPVGEASYCCSQCGVTFGRRVQLSSHMLSHAGAPLDMCEHSEKALAQSAGLKCYETPYQCTQCGLGFSRMVRLKSHQHALSTERPCSCSHDEDPLSRMDSIRRRLQIHAADRPYPLERPKRVSSVAGTAEAEGHIGAGELSYHCKQCGKGFKCGYSLERHQRTHTGEQHYPCVHCERVFSRTDTLKSHQRVHARESSHLKI